MGTKIPGWRPPRLPCLAWNAFNGENRYTERHPQTFSLLFYIWVGRKEKLLIFLYVPWFYLELMDMSDIWTLHDLGGRWHSSLWTPCLAGSGNPKNTQWVSKLYMEPFAKGDPHLVTCPQGCSGHCSNLFSGKHTGFALSLDCALLTPGPQAHLSNSQSQSLAHATVGRIGN